MKGRLSERDPAQLNAFIELLGKESKHIRGPLGTWLNKQKREEVTYTKLVSKANDLILHTYKRRGKGKRGKKADKGVGNVAAMTSQQKTAVGEQGDRKEEGPIRASIKRCHFHPYASNHTTEECNQFKKLVGGNNQGGNPTQALNKPQRYGRGSGGRGRGGKSGYKGRGGMGQDPMQGGNWGASNAQGGDWVPPGGYPMAWPVPLGMPAMPISAPSVPVPPGRDQLQVTPQRVNPFIQCFACNQFGHYARDCVAVQAARMQQHVAPAVQDNKNVPLYSSVKLTSKQLNSRGKLPKEAVHTKLKTRKRLKRRRVEVEDPTTSLEGNMGEEIQKQKSEINSTILLKPIEKVGIGSVSEENVKMSVAQDATMKEVAACHSINNMGEKGEKLGKEERSQFTAAFTTVKIQGRTIRTLADSGASHSAIAASWVKHLKLEQFIRPSDIKLVDAQKEAITIHGELDIMVEFGRKEFKWTFAVADNLFCPLILGMDVLHKGCLNFNKKRIKIQGEIMPVTFNLKELRQFTVIALMNKVVPTQKMVKIKGKVIRDSAICTNMQPNTYVVNTGGMMVDSILTNSRINTNGKGEKEEHITLFAINSTSNKRQIKRGDILATLEVVRGEDVEVILRDSPNSGSPGSRTTSIANRDEEGKINPIHPIASIVAIKLKQSPRGEKARECIPAGGGDNNILRQPELKGGSGGVAFIQPEGVVPEYNEEVSSITALVEGVNQLSNCPSRKGLKVPLVVREKIDDTVGGSGQPELKGGPACTDNPKEVWEDWVSSGMEECGVAKSVVSSSDQRTIQIDGVTLHQPCVHVSPVQVGSTQQSREQTLRSLGDPACCNTIVQEPVPENMECINSQEMLAKGDKVLMEQLIGERNKGQKTIYKGAEQEIIKEMVKESACSEEQKAQLEELLTRYKEILVPGLTAEFTGGNAFFQPHQIKLTHEDPIWTPQFPLAFKEKQLVEDMVKLQYEGGIIEPTSDTKYNSPVLVVPKKGSTFSTLAEAWRPVIDFRNINKATIKGELAHS